MRSIISISAAILATCMAAGQAQAQTVPGCVGVGTPMVFGINGTGFFQVRAGQACRHGFSLMGGGKVTSSRITVSPKNGTARLVNRTTLEYRPRAGFTGADTFAVEATGVSQLGSGTSVLTLNATVN